MKAIAYITLLSFLCCYNFCNAQDDIPTTTGFSGYVIFGAGVFGVKSSLLVTGPPLVNDVGTKQINSIFDSPETNVGFALPIAGEINYTFSKSRTQIHWGNRLEDILRLDVPYGLGVRQELGDGSIIAGTLLFTPLELKYWTDPYIEGEDRIKTLLRFPGYRIRWGRMFKTGLELTATYRHYMFDYESSGQWLVDEGRLQENERQLLVRDGQVLRLTALYRIDVKRKHRFEPRIRYAIEDHDGGAIANEGIAARLTYSYFSPKVIITSNLLYGNREFREVHPVYNERLRADRYGASITSIIPIKMLNGTGWGIIIIGEFIVENANVDFFNSSLSSLIVGLTWRHKRE